MNAGILLVEKKRTMKKRETKRKQAAWTTDFPKQREFSGEKGR